MDEYSGPGFEQCSVYCEQFWICFIFGACAVCKPLFSTTIQYQLLWFDRNEVNAQWIGPHFSLQNEMKTYSYKSWHGSLKNEHYNNIRKSDTIKFGQFSVFISISIIIQSTGRLYQHNVILLSIFVDFFLGIFCYGFESDRLASDQNKIHFRHGSIKCYANRSYQLFDIETESRFIWIFRFKL